MNSKKVARKTLTNNQIQEIIQLYNSGISPKEIGEKFAIFNNSVTRILRKQGIERNQAATKITKEQQDYIIKKYQEGISSETIAKELNINGTTVCRTLKKYNVELRPATENKRKYQINKHWFDNVDTEEKAYFYGLFLADGNVSKRGSQIKIGLLEKDKHVLIKLSNFIYGKNYTKIHKGFCTVYIHSAYIKNKLVNLGCIPNKTFKTKFPDWLDPNLYRHFIRGLIDGDGGIYAKENYLKPVVSLTGTFELLSKIADILKYNLNVSSVYFNKRHKDRPNNIYTIEITGHDKIKRLLDWLYLNSTVYMERKYEEYQKFLERYKIFSEKYKKIIITNKTNTSNSVLFYNDIRLTKNNLEKITNEQKLQIADALFNYFKSNGFPYPRYQYETLINDWNSLKDFNVDYVLENNILNNKFKAGIALFKQFSKCYFTINRPLMKSMLDAFNNDKDLMNVIKNRIGLTLFEDNKPVSFSMTENMLLQGLRNSRIAYGPSVFKPTIAKFIYDKYAPVNGLVYDFSMGMGQRMLGALASDKNLNYIGVDPWPQANKNCNDILDFLETLEPIKHRATIINGCAENYMPETLVNKVDLAFSSPPFWNLEIFDTQNTQAYINYNSYDKFINVWWYNVVKNLYMLLKTNGILALNMTNKNNIMDDMLGTASKFGFKELTRFNIRLSRLHLVKRAKDKNINKYEPIVILKKI